MLPLEIAEALLDDLTSRRGLRETWDSIDPEVQDEIVAEWTRIVDEAMQSRSRAN